MKLKTTPLCSFIIHFKTGSFVFWLLTSTASQLRILPLNLWCSQLICCFIYAMITSRMRLSCHISPTLTTDDREASKTHNSMATKAPPRTPLWELTTLPELPPSHTNILRVGLSTKNESQHLYISYPFMFIIVFVGLAVGSDERYSLTTL